MVHRGIKGEKLNVNGGREGEIGEVTHLSFIGSLLSHELIEHI
jgi:hypothetical protein